MSVSTVVPDPTMLYVGLQEYMLGLQEYMNLDLINKVKLSLHLNRNMEMFVCVHDYSDCLVADTQQ